jgi:lipopolysaccharide export system ATP-binding protein
MKLFSFGAKKKPAKRRPRPRPEAAEPQLEPTFDPAYAGGSYAHGQPDPHQQAYPAQQPADHHAQQWQQPQQSLPGHATGEEPMTGEGLLTAHSVEKSFKTRKVVKGVSLGVARGEAVGLLGPNGAGKTTTFYMITGLIAADTGRITIDGRDITRLPMYRRARLGIGYLPQEQSIFRGLTVEQNIMAVLELVEPSRKKRQYRLDELLDEFKIARLRKSPSIALSGGERRRCEIARSLASNPSFMLLDEPFAGVDPLAVGDIQALVRHLTQRDIGVLITDHNVRETLSLVDRAYVIADGQVLTHGTPQEIIQNEDVRRVYLGDMFG